MSDMFGMPMVDVTDNCEHKESVAVGVSVYETVMQCVACGKLMYDFECNENNYKLEGN